MISIYDFNNYREYLDSWVKSHGSKSHGLKSKIAAAIGVSSTLLSLVLKGEKSLMPEQSLSTCEYLGLTELETDFFILLVEIDRAGSQNLKRRLEKKLRTLQTQAKQVSSRVKKDSELSEEDKAIFYSSWIFSAIRNLIATKKFQTPQEISQRLQLPQKVVTESLDFLLSQQLILREKDGYDYGPSIVFIPKDSNFVNQHHRNWRQKGLETMNFRDEKDLFITTPMSLSEVDAQAIRALMLSAFEKSMKIVEPSPSEKVYCLNIDWFEW